MMKDSYSVMYMVRNLLVGDEEQTRIEDPSYWEDMPENWQQVGTTLIEEDMYDEACLLWIKYHIQGKTEAELTKEAEKFLEEWNKNIEEGAEEHDLQEFMNALNTIKYATYF